MKNEYMSLVKVWSVITMLVIGVALFSVFFLFQQSLRLDESQSLWQTSHTLPQIYYIIAKDVHVPFYHSILFEWQLLFGNGVTTSRTLSLIFFILSIPIMFVLGNRMYNRNIALFATILFALSPFMNWYANEIRMYSLLTLVTLINQYFFIKFFNIVKNQEKRIAWLGYIVSGLFGVYTHYFFFFVILAQAMFFIFNRKSFPQNSFIRFILIVLLFVAAIAPWLYYVHLLGNFSSTEPNFARPTTFDVSNTFSQMLFGFQSDPVNSILVSLWPITVLLSFLTLRKETNISINTRYMLYSLLVPNLGLLIVSFMITPAYLTRYLIFTAPAMYFLLSWIFFTYTPALSKFLRNVFVLLMLVTLGIEAFSMNTPTREDYADAALYLSTHAAPTDVIAVSAPFTIYPIEYYYKGAVKVETLPIWDRTKIAPIPPFIESELPAQVAQLTAGHKNIWLLLSYDQGYQEKMRIYFDTHFQRLEAINFSPKLDLYEYKLLYD